MSGPNLGTLPVTVRLSDGYVNITKICQDNGRSFADWKKLISSSSFLEALSNHVNVPVSDLIQITRGGDNDDRGTYGHHQVAIEVAYWISPEAGAAVEANLGMPRFQYNRKRVRVEDGVVYLAHSEWMPCFKVGMWTSDLKTLVRRYATFYGPDVQVMAYSSETCRLDEERVLELLHSDGVGSELFRKEALGRAQQFLEETLGEGILVTRL